MSNQEKKDKSQNQTPAQKNTPKKSEKIQVKGKRKASAISFTIIINNFPKCTKDAITCLKIAQKNLILCDDHYKHAYQLMYPYCADIIFPIGHVCCSWGNPFEIMLHYRMSIIKCIMARIQDAFLNQCKL